MDVELEVSWEIARCGDFEDVVNSIKEQKCPKSNRRRYNWSLENLNLIKNQGELFLLFDLGQRALTLLSSCHFNPQSTPKFSSIAIILKPWLCINKEIRSCFLVINLHCFNEFLIFYTNYSIWVFYSVYTYIKR